MSIAQHYVLHFVNICFLIGIKGAPDICLKKEGIPMYFYLPSICGPKLSGSSCSSVISL